MAAHYVEVNVKGFKNAVHLVQWMIIMMRNGSEEDGNVRS
jgi:hypothetical protein